MLETEMDGDIETDVATEVEDVEEDNTTSDDEISYEQAMKWKKDSESLQKANKKIASMEKIKKAPETAEKMPVSEAEYEIWAERRDFYKSNAQAKELRDEIEAMITASKWKVDRQKAFELLSWDTEIEENRKVYSKSAVEGNRASSTWFSPISVAQYDNLSDSQRDAYDAKSMKSKGFIDLK